MNALNRPPHYLTEGEFSRLILTDEQWSEIEYRLTERNSALRSEQIAREEKQQENDRVVRPVLASFAGIYLAGFTYLVIEEITGAELWELMGNPLFFVLWTGVTAWLMRKK